MSRFIPGPAGLMSTVNHSENEGTANTQTSPLSLSFPNLGSWRALCKSLDIEVVDIKQENNSMTEAMLANMKKVISVTIQDILEGCYDLRIPRMIAVIQHVSLSYDGSWVLELQDPTCCTMSGFITAHEARKIEAFGRDFRGIFQKGSAVILEKVAIFVSSGPPLKRYLNIHSRNIRAVFTGQ